MLIWNIFELVLRYEQPLPNNNRTAINRYCARPVGLLCGFDKVGHNVVDFAWLLQAIEVHFGARNDLARRNEVGLQRLFRPEDTGCLHRLGVFITRQGARHATDQSNEVRPIFLVGRFDYRMALITPDREQLRSPYGIAILSENGRGQRSCDRQRAVDHRAIHPTFPK